MNLPAFAALIRKDLKLFFTDRRSLMMSFAAPIAIASFFGFVLGGQGDRRAAKIPVWVVDEDRSALSKGLTASLQQEAGLEVRLGATVEARAAVQAGKARAAVVIAPGFGAQAGRALFGAASKPKIGFFHDPSRAPEAQFVKGILTGAVMQVAGRELLGGASTSQFLEESNRSLDGSDLGPRDRKLLRDLFQSVDRWNRSRGGAAASSGGMQVPYELAEEAVAGQGARYNSFAHSFTGMGVQFILFMGIEAGISILLQRQRGLWKRLRAAPVSRGTLLGSRAASAAVCALIILAVLFLFARVVFGVKVEGSMAGFVGVAVTFALMTSGFGLLIASIGNTPEATRPIAILATLIMVMLGGSWIPSFLFPDWLQTATLIVPTRWAVDGLNGMTWRGLPFSEALLPMAALLGFALLFTGIAVKRFRWETE